MALLPNWCTSGCWVKTAPNYILRKLKKYNVQENIDDVFSITKNVHLTLFKMKITLHLKLLTKLSLMSMFAHIMLRKHMPTLTLENIIVI